MPRVSDLVRAAGWRQGSIARPADTRALLIASVDRVPEPGESIVRLVAVTQDCDLVQEPGIEPFVEFVFCRETEAVEPFASAVPKVRVNGRSEDVIFFDGVFFESSLKSIFFAS